MGPSVYGSIAMSHISGGFGARHAYEALLNHLVVIYWFSVAVSIALMEYCEHV